MIFDTLAAMADEANDRKLNNNSTPEQAKEVLQDVKSQTAKELIDFITKSGDTQMPEETITVGSNPAIANNQINDIAHIVVGMQNKTPLSTVQQNQESYEFVVPAPPVVLPPYIKDSFGDAEFDSAAVGDDSWNALWPETTGNISSILTVEDNMLKVVQTEVPDAHTAGYIWATNFDPVGIESVIKEVSVDWSTPSGDDFPYGNGDGYRCGVAMEFANGDIWELARFITPGFNGYFTYKNGSTQGFSPTGSFSDNLWLGVINGSLEAYIGGNRYNGTQIGSSVNVAAAGDVVKVGIVSWESDPGSNPLKAYDIRFDNFLFQKGTNIATPEDVPLVVQ